MSFLAFKKAGIPVGDTKEVVFSQIADDILHRHYHPSSTYPGFYNPFHTSDPENRWTSHRYGSTSLQRITTDTFADALLHPKKSSEWGWKEDYLAKLETHLDSGLIPAFDLAVWLFRMESWPTGTTRETVRYRLLAEYDLTPKEWATLFDLSLHPEVPNWLSETVVTEAELLKIIGRPPGAAPEEGAALRLLELYEIGPAEHFVYEPADRLNIITGDNSLGKTFLLECSWWALTREWLSGQTALPRENIGKNTPSIGFTVTVKGDREGKEYTAESASTYDWLQQTWILPKKRAAVPGLVIYGRFDGSFAVWDPARQWVFSQKPLFERSPSHLFFSPENVWTGLKVGDEGEWLCSGLLRDWVMWQIGGARYEDRWQLLTACLKKLSPSNESLQPGEPMKLPLRETEMPTIAMPYGRVPVRHASAGVQRAVALAYILVWSWFKHLENSAAIRREPQRRLVLLIDEVEAHLHPHWQRVIVPSLMEVLSLISPEVMPQVHLATHSPLVMASAETIFDEDKDDLHHLRLDGNEVRLEELPFNKRGRADYWLMSPVFGLGEPRSMEAEKAIEDAKNLQLADKASPDAVRRVHNRLVHYLAQDDAFWPRWTFFARQHGVDV